MKPYDYYYLAKRNVLANASDRKVIHGTLKPGSRIHISAVCGKAMASVACMLSQAGYVVSGSDWSFNPPMSDVLVSHGIDCRPPSVENIIDIDLFIPGNMLPPHDMEVMEAKRKKIPMMSGAEVVGALITTNKRSLVVTGTHGKTTTSSLLTHIFSQTSKKPAYLIGGVFQHSGESFGMGDIDTSHAIFEGDEYDCAFFDKAPKFLRYNPTSVILTSIEHDHIDLYPTFEDYKQAFQFLVDTVPSSGFLVVHESALEHIDTTQVVGRMLTYGTSPDVYARYAIDSVDSFGTFFSIFIQGGVKYTNIFIPLFGEYNVANATATFLLALSEGVTESEVREGCRTYPGVCERQEIIGVKENNIVVIRDFAHHPTAVKVTLEGLRSHYKDRRIVCVFEPRSVTSRRKVFEHIYPNALENADIALIVSPPFRELDNKSDFMDAGVIKTELEKLKKIAYIASDPISALDVLRKIVETDDVLVFMSNGDFGGIPQKFLQS